MGVSGRHPHGRVPPSNLMIKVIYRHQLWTSPAGVQFIVVVDEYQGSARSVTNAADDVVAAMISRYGNHPIVYRDTDGQWDALAHDGKRFGTFVELSPAARAVFSKEFP